MPVRACFFSAGSINRQIGQAKISGFFEHFRRQQLPGWRIQIGAVVKILTEM